MVVIGGLISATILVAILLPVLYVVFAESIRPWRKGAKSVDEESSPVGAYPSHPIEPSAITMMWIRKFLRLVLICSLACMIASCATYSGKSATASVVDAVTGEPLEGVVVVARWGLINTRTATDAGTLLMSEAMTDARGQFTMPDWGPVRVTMANSGRIPRALDYSEPHLHFFKAGYRYKVVAGPDRRLTRLRGVDWLGDRVRASWWDQQAVRLERATDDIAYYALNLNTEMVPLRNCQWVQVPYMATAYIKETERLQRLIQFAPRETRQELLGESCPKAVHPLTDYLC